MQYIARTLAIVLALVLSSASAAFAATPTNDNRADATVIEATPYSDSVNVAAATTEEGEPTACGSKQSVWYRYKATADETLVATGDGSDFGPAVSVFQGTLSAMSVVTCDSGYGAANPTVVAFKAVEGRTYFIQVAVDSYNVIGTQLDFSLRRQVAVTSAPDRTAWTLDNGQATVTGTVECGSPVSVRLTVYLRQIVDGRNKNYAYNEAFITCDTKTPWQLDLQSEYEEPAFTNEGTLQATVTTTVRSERLTFRSAFEPELVRCTRIGTIENDTMQGTSGKDRLCALGGDDVINSGAGDDIVYASDGADTVDTGRGRDTVAAGAGRDIVELGNSNDIARGGEGRDRIFGEDGADVVYGNGDPDVLSGGAGSDVCIGGPGSDSFRSCETKR